MKQIAITLLIMGTAAIQLFAQDYYPRVQEITTTDKIYHGTIDEYPITIYLSFQQYSDYHLGLYSAKGWYYYDKFKTKIPLVALCSESTLYLYNFKNPHNSDELLYFRGETSNHREDIEYYQNLKNYNEKFVITDSEKFWLSGDKKLNINLYCEDISVQSHEEYLMIDSVTSFDLNNFPYVENFELVAHSSGQYLLKYTFGSRLNVMGMCGAGIEEGFLYLKFSDTNEFIESKNYRTESCLQSINTTNQNSINGIITYNCTSFSNDAEYDVIIDLNKCTIEQIMRN